MTIENCDDGSNDSEGCQLGCKSGVRPEWICTGGNPTTPTQCIPKCGDGKVVGNETCDDGNKNDGKGCEQTNCIGNITGWNC